ELKTRTIAIVIGEGGSGGALAIGVADRLAMMRNSVFSVISPEGCAAILWNDPSKSEAATKAMKITADDLKELNLIDDVIDEPVMGAHRDRDGAIAAVGEYIRTQLEELESLSIDEVVSARMEKILSVGAYE
ncbi:MAG: acetyl-CoA carboxylase carboxyl transferase subunit alpha, partial [Campylobacter sp.]|nr:acetyl-CoA carboxylase carboxyl transferase subunit alpha [Campylobacter sp.]